MFLTETAQYLLSRSGQFILPRGLQSLRLDLDTLWATLMPVINDYSRYTPAFKQFNITTTSHSVYDFTHDPNGIPRKVFSAYPCNTLTVVTVLTSQLTIFGREMFQPTRLVDPRTCLKMYRAPKLYLTEAGTFDITASYPYEFILTKDDDGKLTEVEIPVLGTEETHQILLDLMYGQFLKMVGNARGSFQYADFPVTTNAASLLQEGQQVYKDALEQLYQRSRWWLSIRG